MESEKLNKLLIEKSAFLNYFKSIFPVFHKSNVFFRDLQYAIQRYLELKGMNITYANSEKLALGFSAALENEKIFKKINGTTWTLNHEPFLTGAAHAIEGKS